ncbi:MAG TPA: YeeE/YedE thiosulfate transporter family protein, partial [Hyphomicrobiales bacterium]|nr:YeeE/YedE thiosulfate transporter family protein [Hyphomicrobiales bacterium]
MSSLNTIEDSTAPASAIERQAQTAVWVAAAAALAVIAGLAANIAGWRIGVGGLLGGLGGFALYHASFGFTSAWRNFIRTRRGTGLRAQFLLIALIILVSFPLIAWSGSVNGYVFPFGVAAAVGAFLFGFGMQLGGGCGSGTLYTVGGGSTRMVITLSAFIFGSVLATAHWDAWQGLPRFPAMS